MAGDLVGRPGDVYCLQAGTLASPNNSGGGVRCVLWTLLFLPYCWKQYPQLLVYFIVGGEIFIADLLLPWMLRMQCQYTDINRQKSNKNENQMWRMMSYGKSHSFPAPSNPSLCKWKKEPIKTNPARANTIWDDIDDNFSRVALLSPGTSSLSLTDSWSKT